MAHTIAVLSQKGGTGKTTAVRTLTDVLRRSGVRTLAVDLDPQGNLSDYFDLPTDVGPTIADVLSGRATTAEAIHQDIIPANMSLAEAELMLGGKMGRELTLRRALAESAEDYDVILIDCPPSLGLLTVNALVAAAEVLIPIQCEYYALEGLEQLLRTVDLVKSHLNPELAISTILLTMYDGRTRLASQVAEEVRSHFGEVVLQSIIPRSVRVSEAPSYGQSVMTYDPGSSGALAYLEAAREMAFRSQSS
ncbi:MAG TPA: ParA family protein [Solirubrobacteraceae bacterium]|nr:ParA family protein [Solirubrobacteraceae bacterium]